MRSSVNLSLATLGFVPLLVGVAFADVAIQIGTLGADDPASRDNFGSSVAISGTTALVGAHNDDDNGVQSGSAYLFNTVTGHQTLKLVPLDGMSVDNFGVSVALNDTTAIVGAPTNGSGPGSVYVFDVITGSELARLQPSDAMNSDQFGVSVAISGTSVIVGSPGDDDNGCGSGSAYLFDTATGFDLIKLLPADGAAGDRFGTSVAICGTTAIIGATSSVNNGSSSGSAYLFDVTNGTQIAELIPSGGADFDSFGVSVAISNSIIVVGAQGDDDNGLSSGSAYVFDAASGSQVAKLIPTDGAASDLFGGSVAISDSIAVIGARSDDDNGLGSGSVYLFDTGTGTQVQKLLPTGGGAGDAFGGQIATSGTIAIVGAQFFDGLGVSIGAAYLFDTGCEPASVVSRNDGGFNASILSNVTNPVLDTDWATDLDCSGHSPSIAVLLVFTEPSSGIFVSGGEVLVDPSSALLTSTNQVHMGGIVQLAIAVPRDTSLCGLAASAQGVVFGSPGYELSNALDLVVGL